jgi:hypothetical protein
MTEAELFKAVAEAEKPSEQFERNWRLQEEIADARQDIRVLKDLLRRVRKVAIGVLPTDLRLSIDAELHEP